MSAALRNPALLTTVVLLAQIPGSSDPKAASQATEQFNSRFSEDRAEITIIPRTQAEQTAAA